MRTAKPHFTASAAKFTITRINDYKTIWRLVALIVAASLILLFVTAMNFAGAATNPPQGNVVPNFSGLTVAGTAEIKNKLITPNIDTFNIDVQNGIKNTKGTNVVINDDLNVTGKTWFDDYIDTPKIYTSTIESPMNSIAMKGSVYLDPAYFLNAANIRGEFGKSTPVKLWSDLTNPDHNFDIGGVIKNSGTTNGGSVKINDILDVDSLKNSNVTTAGGSSVDLPLYIFDDVKISGYIKSMYGGIKIPDDLDVFGEITNSSYSGLNDNPVSIGENLEIHGDVAIKGGGKLMRDGTNYFDYVEVEANQNVTNGSVASISAVCDIANGYYPLSCSSEPQGTTVYRMWNNKSAGSCELLVLNQNGFATTVKIKAACAKP